MRLIVGDVRSRVHDSRGQTGTNVMSDQVRQGSGTIDPGVLLTMMWSVSIVVESCWWKV